jgi:hypothetical protein
MAPESVMTKNRLRLYWLVALGAVTLLFFVVAGIGLTILSGQSKKLVDLKQQSKTVDAQSTSLAAAKKQVEMYSYFNDIAKTVLPTDKDQAQAVLDIFNLADQSGIAIASITFPASSLGNKAAPTASGGNAATAPASSAISQAKAVEGIPGLYSLELIISPQTGTSVPDAKKVTYTKFLDFLSRIENDRRTAQITQVNIQPQGSDNGPSQFINFTMTINIFMKP